MSTFIGRILVIVIASVALLFLGISTVAFSTARDWSKATQGLQKKVADLKKDLQKLSEDQDKAKKVVDDAKVALAAETKAVNSRLSALKEENKRDTDKIISVRDEVLKAHDAASKTLQEVEAKRKQIDQLHLQQAAVDKQANEFRLNQVQLTDLIRELERIIQTTAKNKSDLQKQRTGKFSAMLR
jgi:Sec-independent protein translocase protein TatA